MSTTINLPVLLAQLPHLAKLTAAEQSAPAQQGHFSEELAKQQQARDKSRVQEVEEQDHPGQVDERKREAGQQHASKREREEKDTDGEQEELSESKTPWAGNIINMKI